MGFINWEFACLICREPDLAYGLVKKGVVAEAEARATLPFLHYFVDCNAVYQHLLRVVIFCLCNFAFESLFNYNINEKTSLLCPIVSSPSRPRLRA